MTFWVNRLSFGEVAKLLTQFSGTALLSEDSVWRLVQSEAQHLDTLQLEAITQSASLPEPAYAAPEDLYDPSAEEFITMTDAIGVKAQKPTREKTGQAKKPKTQKRHDTDVLILPRPDGSEQVICEGTSGQWSLVDAVRAFLRLAWSGTTLQVVALTDGAKVIRADLTALFGVAVRIILDWYHLEKRVYQQLSMSAYSKAQREEWEKHVLALLWRGNVDEAKTFLLTLKPRNAAAMHDMITYLDKHAEEIIDYERRQKAGKVIGSGRMEKGVDQVIGHRQKGKGTSWTQEGSRALALIKAAELNAKIAAA